MATVVWRFPTEKPRAPPEPGSFFEKKEPKKLYNGKLRFPTAIPV